MHLTGNKATNSMLLNALRNKLFIGRNVRVAESPQPQYPDSSPFSCLLRKSRLEILFNAVPSDPRATQDSAALRHWFSQLETTCRKSAGFDDALSTALRFTPEQGKPVFQQQVIETPDWVVSLMGINRLMPIPLHDHPDIYSAQLVLHGKLRVRHFNAAVTQPDNPSTAYLTPTADRVFRRGEISSVTPGERNIHELAATSMNAVFLSIQSQASGERRQSWYFPVDPLHQKGPEWLCYRLAKGARRNPDRSRRESYGTG